MDKFRIDTTAGAMLIAGALSWCLYGCLVAQFYTYGTTHTGLQDPAWLIWTVRVLILLESIFTFLMNHHAWISVVDWFGGDPLTPVPWTATVCPGLIAIIATTVQLFFARRIWILSGKSKKGSAISISVIALAMSQGILGLEVTAKCVSMFCLLQRAHAVSKLWYAKNAITGELNNILKKLIINCIESGSIVTLAALIELLLFLKYPQSYLKKLPMYSISRLYTMALLASLNSRALTSSMEREQGDIVSVHAVTVLRFSTGSNPERIERPAEGQMSVKSQK
ncbi:hypothetical protein AX16_003935 [Volvariella volvacea WC 439]|nr:hypothetical protein AX16_003935 [Volvariella volvacea WC 439]